MVYLPINATYQERRKNVFAVVIYLPPNLDSIIAPFREKYDPFYNVVPGHITLVFPFESQKPLEDLTRLIKMETDVYPPLTIEMESIGDFYPESPVIFWSIKKNPPVSELYFRLYARLELPIPYKNYVPHATVAREISDHRVITVKDRIVSYLPQEEFNVGAVDLVTPLVNNKWVSVRTFSLITEASR